MYLQVTSTVVSMCTFQQLVRGELMAGNIQVGTGSDLLCSRQFFFPFHRTSQVLAFSELECRKMCLASPVRAWQIQALTDFWQESVPERRTHHREYLFI